jgi:hypothetical protein
LVFLEGERTKQQASYSGLNLKGLHINYALACLFLSGIYSIDSLTMVESPVFFQLCHVRSAMAMAKVWEAPYAELKR